MKVIYVIICSIIALLVLWGSIVKFGKSLGNTLKSGLGLVALIAVVVISLVLLNNNKSNYESSITDLSENRTILCSDGSTAVCGVDSEECEDFSLKYCAKDINSYRCNNNKTYRCNANEPTCYDNSPTYCSKTDRLAINDYDNIPTENNVSPITITCADGTVHECDPKSFDCIDDSPLYCSQTDIIGDGEIVDTPPPPKTNIPEATSYNCKETGEEYPCFNNSIGCFPNSKVYCNKGGDKWCEYMGGTTLPNGECSFPDWDTCNSLLGCITDPAEAHPGWYDISLSSNDFERQQVVNNGGEAAMEIVDECNMNNTTANKNPRCNIKHGKFKGKIGVCVYDGMNIQECQPYGQQCNNSIPQYCSPTVTNKLTGKEVNVNPMCYEKDGVVTMQCTIGVNPSV